MVQTACTTAVPGAVAALLLATKGGVLCRPTVSRRDSNRGVSDPGVRVRTWPRRCSGVAHARMQGAEITDRFRGNCVVICARKSGCNRSGIKRWPSPALRPFILRERLGASGLVPLRSPLARP